MKETIYSQLVGRISSINTIPAIKQESVSRKLSNCRGYVTSDKRVGLVNFSRGVNFGITPSWWGFFVNGIRCIRGLVLVVYYLCSILRQLGTYEGFLQMYSHTKQTFDLSQAKQKKPKKTCVYVCVLGIWIAFEVGFLVMPLIQSHFPRQWWLFPTYTSWNNRSIKVDDLRIQRVENETCLNLTMLISNDYTLRHEMKECSGIKRNAKHL